MTKHNHFLQQMDWHEKIASISPASSNFHKHFPMFVDHLKFMSLHTVLYSVQCVEKKSSAINYQNFVKLTEMVGDVWGRAHSVQWSAPDNTVHQHRVHCWGARNVSSAGWGMWPTTALRHFTPQSYNKT